MLIAFHSHQHTDWDKYIPELQFTMNTVVHEAHKTTPFRLMFNFTPICPLTNKWKLLDFLSDTASPEETSERWLDAGDHRSRVEKYNKGRSPVPFKVGDLVLLRAHTQSHAAKHITHKLSSRYLGPYRILKVCNEVSFQLQHCVTGTKTTAHASQLKAVPSR